jgi:hypothetical protein
MTWVNSRFCDPRSGTLTWRLFEALNLARRNQVTAVSASKRRAMVGAQPEVAAIADEDQAMQAPFRFCFRLSASIYLAWSLRCAFD